MSWLKKSNFSEHICPSGDNTPVFSWSPLPQRRRLGLSKEEMHENPEKELKLYPRCDANIWLRSCEQEIIEPIVGNIKGAVPKWLNGSLIRNGPGSLKVGSNDEFNHLFDSSALLHRFGIDNGEITYQCRFLQTETLKKNRTANRIVLTEFGTKSVPDPCLSIFQRIAAIFTSEATDNSMISVYPFGDELYAFGELPLIHRINPNTLETEDRVKINEYVSVVNHTSHPHVMGDGTVYNLAMTIYPTGPHHTIVCFSNNESRSSKTMFQNAKIVASIPARWPLNPSYMHSFGMTDNYFIIIEQPLSISVPGMLTAKVKNEPLAGCFRWYHEETTQINVVSRQSGSLAFQFQAEAFFYLHVINQYEIEEHVVLDICIYKDPAMLDCMYVDAMRSMQGNPDYAKMFRGRPARFVLPLINVPIDARLDKNLVKLKGTTAKAYYTSNSEIFVKPEKIVDLGCETPRINYDCFLGKPYRYFYAISSDVDADNPGMIIRVDTVDKTTNAWCEDNCFPSEPIFVPKPNSQGEDDGIILSSLIWGGKHENRVGLLILDAVTFEEIARTEFTTPGPVPKCLHGWFWPSL